MSEETETTAPKPKSKALLFGLVLALVLGAGGFVAAQNGVIPGLSAGQSHDAALQEHETESELHDDVEFVPVEPLIITLTSSQRYSHLRFAAEIEVPSGKSEAVIGLMPRIVDAMNGYLRAVQPRDLEEDGALLRLRSQLLRRVQLIVGDDHATNLLVMEFVLN